MFTHDSWPAATPFSFVQSSVRSTRGSGSNYTLPFTSHSSTRSFDETQSCSCFPVYFARMHLFLRDVRPRFELIDSSLLTMTPSRKHERPAAPTDADLDHDERNMNRLVFKNPTLFSRIHERTVRTLLLMLGHPSSQETGLSGDYFWSLVQSM